MQIRFEVGHIYTTFRVLGEASVSDIAEVTDLIRSVTSARPQGYQYMPRYKTGQWDGFIHLCRGNKFPTGLLSKVIDSLPNDINNVTLEDRSDEVELQLDCVRDDVFDNMQLRSYQLDAVRKLLSYGRGVAKMATNSGKTEVMALIAKAVVGRVLVLTTKKDILYQTVDRFGLRLGENIGIVGDGSFSIDRVTIGMIQTLYNRMKMHDRFELSRLHSLACVMFDECHHVPSKTAQNVLLTMSAPLKFGFSGTPLSYDDLSDMLLIGATGPIVVDVTNAELIEDGISARPQIHMYEIFDDAYRDSEYDWHTAYDAFVVNNEERNNIIRSVVKSSSASSTLILVERIDHGRLLQELLSDNGNVVFVSGSDTMEDRLSALDLLRSGVGAIVIATSIFDEGVDVPAVDLLVLAGGGKGHKKLLQRLGRGMRRKEGNNTLTVIDFVDDTHDYLLQHSYDRCAIYEEEGFNVKLLSHIEGNLQPVHT